MHHTVAEAGTTCHSLLSVYSFGSYEALVLRVIVYSINTVMYIVVLQVNRLYSTMGSSIPEGILLGIGNPLLDMTIIGADAEKMLKEYELSSNNAILAKKKHESLFEKCVKECKPIYLAGGATQNTIRVAQWLLQQPNATTFLVVQEMICMKRFYSRKLQRWELM